MSRSDATVIVVRRRILVAALSAATVVAGLVVAVEPASATTSFWCSNNGDTAPCVESASVQVGSAALETLTPSSTDYYPVLQDCTDTVVNNHCTGSVAWGLADGDPDHYSLDTHATLTLDLGTYIPSENDIFGVNATVTRNPYGAASYRETISAQPTYQDGFTDGASCTETNSNEFLCPDQATDTSVGLNGLINDNYNDGNPPEMAAASYGLDDWTTSFATGPPLFLGSTPAGTITIPIGNSHLHQDGSVVQSQYNAVLPNALLEYMGIDDPTTITSSSLAVTLQSGNVSVTPNSDGVDINLSDITWPEPPGAGAIARLAGVAGAKKAADKPLRIAPGVITPSRAVDVHARRVSKTSGHVTFSGAKPRGSKITHFQVSCSAKHHVSRTGTSKSRKHLRVHKLASATSYSCRVRAVSKAGRGKWSKGVTLKR
jgi:Fibronectin type III domain